MTPAMAAAVALSSDRRERRSRSTLVAPFIEHHHARATSRRLPASKGNAIHATTGAAWLARVGRRGSRWGRHAGSRRGSYTEALARVHSMPRGRVCQQRRFPDCARDYCTVAGIDLCAPAPGLHPPLAQVSAHRPSHARRMDARTPSAHAHPDRDRTDRARHYDNVGGAGGQHLGRGRRSRVQRARGAPRRSLTRRPSRRPRSDRRPWSAGQGRTGSPRAPPSSPTPPSYCRMGRRRRGPSVRARPGGSCSRR